MGLEEKFLASYDLYAPALLRHIFFRVNDSDLAEELVQETFFKAWRHLALKNEDIKNPKAFLYRIADNLIIDSYRKKPTRPLSLEELEKEPVFKEEAREKKLDFEFLVRFLNLLNEEQKRVLLLRFVDNLSISEISRITGKTANNIRVIVHRGLQELKKKSHV